MIYNTLKEFNKDVDGVNVRIEVGTQVELDEETAKQLLIDGFVEAIA